MNENFAMDWDAVLGAEEEKKTEWQPLPEGEYDFTVIGFERGTFPGSAKIGKCAKAIITIEVQKTHIRFDLIMWRSLEWKVASFFRCIGLKKHGEELKMEWSKVVGSKGRAKIGIREYTGKDGNTYRTNEVLKFLEPEETKGGFYDI